MRRTRLTAALVALAPLVPAHLGAQWEALGRLAPGESIRVYRDKQAVLKGRLDNWQPEKLTLRDGRGQPLFAERTSVRKVTVSRRHPRWKAALWGFAIGFAPSFAVGYATAPTWTDWGSGMPAGERFKAGLGFGAFFGGIGAGIGALAGAEKEDEVYRRQ